MGKYTEHYPEWIRLYREGKSIVEIGKQYAVDRRTVWAALKSRRVKCRPIPEYVKHQEYKQHHEDWVRLYKQGVSADEIALRYEAEAITICRALESMGIKRRSNAEAQRKWHIKNEEAFRVIDTPEKAYWLGFLMADGNVYREAGRVQKVRWALQVNLNATDEGHLTKLLGFLDTDYPLYRWGKTNAVMLKIVSKLIVESLIDKGCVEKKSLILQFPGPDKVPSSLHNHFIRGYFDGDGGVAVYRGTPRVTISSGSHAFVSSIMNLLVGNEIVTRLSLYRKKNGRLSTITTQDRQNVADLYGYLYEDATVYLDRKKAKFEEVLGIE